MIEDRLVDAKWVAEFLDVKISWVREATRDQRLPCVRLGRYVRYDVVDISAWVAAQKRPGRRYVPRRGVGPP